MDRAKALTLTALRNVVDPELGVDVVSLGLVYGVEAGPERLKVAMTLTTKGCPMGEVIVGLARESLAGVAGDRTVELDLVWSPSWSPQMMDEEARELLRGGP